MKNKNISTLTQIRVHDLDFEQLQAINSLTELCQMNDSSSLSYPTAPDEAACHYLLFAETEQKKQLLSALAFIPYDDQTAECLAFTAPAFRRQGCFSTLLDALLEDYEDYDLLFPVSENSPDSLAALAALGAEHDHDDLQMCLELSSAKSNRSEVSPEAFSSCRLCSSINEDDTETTWSLLSAKHSECTLGTCQTTIFSERTVCLHHVEIDESFRNQGLGFCMLLLLIEKLKTSGIQQILLHVSGDNAPAVALYKKTGFRITETLSFYLY